MRTTLLALALLSSAPVFAADAAKVERIESGNRVSENLPAIPGELLERLNQYQNTRGASFQGWIDNGSMLIASMVDYHNRIRAGIDVVGISHFTSFLTNTESYRRDLRRAEYGDERIPEMRAFHEKIAPLNNAKSITSPLFVAQGFNDPRVPYTEAEQIVKAVRGNGGDVWYLMFKDEGHGFAKKANNDYFGAASMVFWQKYLLE